MFILRLIAHLPNGQDWKSLTFDTIPQAENQIASEADKLALKHYDLTPHGFEEITADIIDRASGGVCCSFVYTRQMFESAHKGEVIKAAACGCWLTAGAGRWQSHVPHDNCLVRIAPAFAI